MSLRISFVSTCKGRLFHLRKTLPQNIKDNADYPNVEFVVLDYNSEDGLQEWIFENFQADIESGRLKYVHYPEPKHFHMAHAKNLGHRVSTGDVICTIDADNYTGKGFAAYLNKQFTARKGIYCRAAKHIRRELPDTGLGGRIALRRSDFLTIGGYNEEMGLWGPDDTDVAKRLQNIGLQEIEIPRRYLGCIVHDDAVRQEHYAFGQTHTDEKPKVSEKQSSFPDTYNTDEVDDDYYRSKYKTDYGEATTVLHEHTFYLWGRHLVTLQNEGNIGSGRVYINNSKEPTNIAPLPTRIFRYWVA